jgi:glycosyltransferase involved in cell wall biosynthesis
MSRAIAAVISFRLGGTDGVSVEARKWEWALHELGFETRRIAGELEDGVRTDDTWLGFLAIDPVPGAGRDDGALSAALAAADLVVAENICSLPLNVEASRAVARAASGVRGRVLFHHHDLPWERPQYADLGSELPPDPPGAMHVTISDHAHAELARRRGIDSVVIRNAFDPDPEPGEREDTRAAFGFAPDDVVVVQPTRAIPRKGVDVALEYCGQLERVLGGRVRYWLTGPAEDGYGPVLDGLLARAPVRVTRGRTARVADVYAAADVVLMPSTWEGFGNPIVEATLARRPVVVTGYPVLDELVALGVDPFPVDDARGLAAFLSRSETERRARLDRAALRVGAALSLAELPGRLAAAFAQRGWTSW